MLLFSLSSSLFQILFFKYPYLWQYIEKIFKNEHLIIILNAFLNNLLLLKAFNKMKYERIIEFQRFKSEYVIYVFKTS